MYGSAYTCILSGAPLLVVESSRVESSLVESKSFTFIRLFLVSSLKFTYLEVASERELSARAAYLVDGGV